VSDLTERLQAAATVAIADVAPAIEASGRRLQLVTVEVEVGSVGQVVGATAWIENKVNVNRLLGDRGPR